MVYNPHICEVWAGDRCQRPAKESALQSRSGSPRDGREGGADSSLIVLPLWNGDGCLLSVRDSPDAEGARCLFPNWKCHTPPAGMEPCKYPRQFKTGPLADTVEVDGREGGQGTAPLPAPFPHELARGRVVGPSKPGVGRDTVSRIRDGLGHVRGTRQRHTCVCTGGRDTSSRCTAAAPSSERCGGRLLQCAHAIQCTLLQCALNGIPIISQPGPY